MLRIAIIDDEINTNLLMDGNQIKKQWMDSKIISLKKKSKEITHSTVITKIIKGFVEETIEYKLINIIAVGYKDHYFSYDIFIESLIYAAEICPNILLLSVGTTLPGDAMHINSIIQKMVESGTLIISAICNENKVTFPAYFDNVLAVRWNHKSCDSVFFWRTQNDILNTDFVVSYTKDDLCYFADIETDPSNSFAVPFLLAKIIRFVEKNKGCPIEILIKKIKMYAEFPFRDFNLDYIISDEYAIPFLVCVLMESEEHVEILSDIIYSLYRNYRVTAVCLNEKKRRNTNYSFIDIKMSLELLIQYEYYKNISCDLIFVENPFYFENDPYDIIIRMLRKSVQIYANGRIVETFGYTSGIGNEIAAKIVDIGGQLE